MDQQYAWKLSFCAGPVEKLKSIRCGFASQMQSSCWILKPISRSLFHGDRAGCKQNPELLNFVLTPALEFLQPALDFSHNNPVFCHPIYREKRHAGNPSNQQDIDENSRWKAVDPSADGCRPGWIGLRFGRFGFKRGS